MIIYLKKDAKRTVLAKNVNSVEILIKIMQNYGVNCNKNGGLKIILK